MWIIPSEFSQALEGLGRLSGEDSGDGRQPASWLTAASAGTPPPSTGIDTSGWFDSQLPPAHQQPEALNLRASDHDPDS